MVEVVFAPRRQEIKENHVRIYIPFVLLGVIATVLLVLFKLEKRAVGLRVRTPVSISL